MSNRISTRTKPKPEKTSVLLRNVLIDLTGESVTIGQLLSGLGHRSFGGIMILVAALGLIPGIAIVAGIVMMLLGVQMLRGLIVPRLPKLISERQVEVRLVKDVGGKCVTWIETIEKWVKPRWSTVTIPGFDSLVGAVIVAIGFVAMIPLPFTNFLPAVALLLLSVGQLERDGVMIVSGLAIAAIALIVGLNITLFAIQSLIALLV